MRAGREVKSFGPEAIVPNHERDDCMEEVLEEVAQVGVLTVENLNRMNDAFAKFIFANEARKLLTLDLVNSFFEFEGTAQITDFKFIDREQDPDRKWGKGVVLDVVGESSDGTLVNVEIQLQQFDDMDRRTLYYWAQLYTRRLLSGEDYDNLNRTVAINILDFRLFSDEIWPDYHSCFAVLNTRNAEHALTKDLEIHFVELPKLADPASGTLVAVFIAEDDYGREETAGNGRRKYSYRDGSGEGVCEESDLHYCL